MAKNILLILVVFLLVALLSFSFAEEKLTITTYYPSPYGSYRELRTQRMALGSNYINSVAYTWEESDDDGGEIDYIADLVVEGNVGIGTTEPLAKLDVQGQISGGFGAVTIAGTLDWNDSTNARPGNGYTLLLGSATNGPGPARYFHPFTFEYGTKRGTGNMIQFAIPYLQSYTDGGSNIWMRSRYSGTWTEWRKILSEDANGNVGIGTTGPSGKLGIKGSSWDFGLDTGVYPAIGRLWYKSDGTGYGISIGRKASSDSSYTDYVYIKDGGNVGIGTTSPAYILDVGNMASTSNVTNTIRLVGRYVNANGTYANFRLSNSSDSGGSYFGIVARRESNNYGVSTDFTVNNTGAGATPLTAMTLQYSGNVGIGTTAPTYQLQLSTNSAAKPTSNVWTIASDRRLKKNIRPLKGALDTMLRLRGITYQWKEPEKFGNMSDTYMGLIGQEVEKVIPEWVGTDKDGYKNLNTCGFEAITIEAMKELKAQNDALKARIAALEAKIK